MSNEWRTDEPPKDADFIADVGMPLAVHAAWNPVEEDYLFTVLQIDLYQGKWNDWSFETSWVEDEGLTIKAWMPMPEVMK